MTFEERAAKLSTAEMALILQKVDSLESQLNWFKRQLFGRKSEKLIELDTSVIPDMFAGLDLPKPQSLEPEETVSVPAHKRKKKKIPDSPDDTGLRFNASVPVKEIEVPCPELEAEPHAFEMISTKCTYRLAQRPSAYVILKYVRKVIKRIDTQAIINTPAPINVLEKSYADVSFLAGMLVDKFDYHLPLYRQHRRLLQGGITLSRATLTHLVYKSILLLKPIYDAILRSILLSKVLAMDETPIKYSRKKKGVMKKGYYWPIYGEQNEIAFCFASTRATSVVHQLLGDFSGTLLSDGYTAYEKYANKTGGVTRGQCWSHGRRPFDKALKMEPQSAQQALQMIAALYKIEEDILALNLSGKEKLAHRQKYSKPIVDTFFNWVREQRQRQDLVNSNPLSKALLYVEKRERAMRVFLDDPEVPLDTNHLERQIRYIAMGKNAWMFCWSEVGAEHVGVIQSIICSCKLQGIDPYVYLVDVLQRVSSHPASKIDDLIPRNWKEKFSHKPLRSDIDL